MSALLKGKLCFGACHIKQTRKRSQLCKQGENAQASRMEHTSNPVPQTDGREPVSRLLERSSLWSEGSTAPLLELPHCPGKGPEKLLLLSSRSSSFAKAPTVPQASGSTPATIISFCSSGLDVVFMLLHLLCMEAACDKSEVASAGSRLSPA